MWWLFCKFQQWIRKENIPMNVLNGYKIQKKHLFEIKKKREQITKGQLEEYYALINKEIIFKLINKNHRHCISQNSIWVHVVVVKQIKCWRWNRKWIYQIQNNCVIKTLLLIILQIVIIDIWSWKIFKIRVMQILNTKNRINMWSFLRRI